LLERPITTIKKPIILQTEEEIMTFLTLKLIVITSFQWRRREKKCGAGRRPKNSD
jgi:hypothetical protein